MRKAMAGQAIRAGVLLLLLAAMPLAAQGVPQQEYSGLDKYLGQGRLNNSSFVGVRAAEFLTIPVGARGIGMGGAYTATVDDISAVWWNPAGLGFLQKKEVMLTVVDYTMDLNYSFAAAAFPIADGNVVVGGFFGYLDIPDMEITTVANPGGTGSMFRAYDFQMGGSLAYNFSDRFTGGLNLKYIHQDVMNNIGGNAFAIDAGAIYHTEFMEREIKFAFAIQNLGTNITMGGPNLIRAVGAEDREGGMPSGYQDFSTDPYSIAERGERYMMLRTHTYRLPSSVKMALSYSLLSSEKVNWLATAEMLRPSYIPLSYAAGTEMNYSYDPFLSFAIRTGWMFQTDEFDDKSDQFGYEYYGNDDGAFRGFSIGGGVQRIFGTRKICFNYAYKNKGRLSADNFFTMSFGF
ncbi:PorV/PorQ family protein [bacterium]|nr:PorV/PorQ family protein [bacterium]